MKPGISLGFFLILVLHHSTGLEVERLVNFAVRQYTLTSERLAGENSVFISTGDPTGTMWHTTEDWRWTSGFYGGVLWTLYKLTNDDYWKINAMYNQEGVRHRENDTQTHDVGFVIMSTFGLGLEYTGNKSYEATIIQAARSLSTRFHPLSRCIRSWNNDPGHGNEEGEVKVIADNMMNLELMFKASELSGNNTFKEMAISHAIRTGEEHFRTDGGTFHVVAYNETTGDVRRKYTWQGYSNSSTWARGCAWVIHGYITTFNFTKDNRFLELAETAAKYYIQRLPNDTVPYWDFDCPFMTTYQPRDSSAAAIAAHGLLKLYIFTKNSTYLNYATKSLDTLSSPRYRADGKAEYRIPSILVNGTVFFNENNFDTAIVYGDFYFLQALDLYNKIRSEEKDDHDHNTAGSKISSSVPLMLGCLLLRNVLTNRSNRM